MAEIILAILSILLSVIILIIVSVVIFNIYKNQIKKIKEENETISLFRESLSELKPSKKDFDAFNKLVRGFFKQIYNIDYNLTYLEIAERFKRENSRKTAEFCNEMSDWIYSKKDLTKNDFNRLTEDFKKILGGI